jgi:hypothetical protein
MKQRITPSGHVVIERPEGLYLIGPLDRAMEMAEAERIVRYTFDGEVHRVDLLDNEDEQVGPEWGASALSQDEALRFALAAFLGSYEDQELH